MPTNPYDPANNPYAPNQQGQNGYAGARTPQSIANAGNQSAGRSMNTDAHAAFGDAAQAWHNVFQGYMRQPSNPTAPPPMQGHPGPVWGAPPMQDQPGPGYISPMNPMPGPGGGIGTGGQGNYPPPMHGMPGPGYNPQPMNPGMPSQPGYGGGGYGGGVPPSSAPPIYGGGVPPAQHTFPPYQVPPTSVPPAQSPPIYGQVPPVQSPPHFHIAGESNPVIPAQVHDDAVARFGAARVMRAYHRGL